MSITLGVGSGAPVQAASDKTFQAGKPTEYAHQESEQITVGAKPYTTDELVAGAFGKKIDFAKYGIVPVLIVIENKRAQAVDLRAVQTSLVAADGRHVDAVAPEELPTLATSGRHPSQNGVPMPLPMPKKKNPLSAPEIGVRAFAAKMLAPGDSASGFLYFEAASEKGDKLYVNGLRDAKSGKEMLYFEFALEKEP